MNWVHNKPVITVLIGIFVIIALVVTSYFTVTMAQFQAQYLLMNRVKQHLTALCDSKTRQVADYLQSVSKQIQWYALNRELIEALQGFRTAFLQFREEAITPISQSLSHDDYYQAVTYFYLNDFFKEYRTVTVDEIPDLTTLLGSLDDNSIALQYYYLAINPNPIETKEELTIAIDHSRYTQLHYNYHNNIKELKKYLEIEDILLVDSQSGMVVYSINKRLDFATSLITGPYATTALGTLFQQTNSKARGDVVWSDFSPYFPAYNNPIMFVATPVFNGEQRIGVLIFQMSVEGINKIMTNHYVWSAAEFGRTGETYLVAVDGTMRSDSRLFIEDKALYLAIIEQREELTPEVISQINLKNTTVGLQKVDNLGTQSVFTDLAGFTLYEDYHDDFVFAAYAPLNVPYLPWAVFATQSEEEALQPLAQFRAKTHWGSIQIVIGMLLIGLIGLLLGWQSPRQSSQAEFVATPPMSPKKYTIEQLIEHLNKLR